MVVSSIDLIVKFGKPSPNHVLEEDSLKAVTASMKPSSGRTIWPTLLLLILLASTAEWVTRLEFFQAPLTPPKLGSRHYQLGHKLALLEAEVKQNGPIDCIMVGSSMADVGFEPDSFRESYREATGRDVRCFNFGVDAASAVSTYALTRILIEDYHPRFLIFGTDPRDYAVPSSDRDPAAILDTPWVQYRQGRFSLEGWLLENSYFYRYRQHLSRLVHFNFEGTLWVDTHLNFPILPNGFTPIEKINTRVHEPPDPGDTSYEVTYYSRIYSSYTILDENLTALERIMDYNGLETQVIVVEMPVSDGLYYFFGNGKADYGRFVSSVAELAALHQIPFWQAESLVAIPYDGWSDYSHLNVTGADVFSVWLGGQVASIDIP